MATQHQPGFCQASVYCYGPAGHAGPCNKPDWSKSEDDEDDEPQALPTTLTLAEALEPLADVACRLMDFVNELQTHLKEAKDNPEGWQPGDSFADYLANTDDLPAGPARFQIAISLLSKPE